MQAQPLLGAESGGEMARLHRHRSERWCRRVTRVPRRAVRILLVGGLFVPLAALPASAGRNVWTPIGPDGGVVLALAADPIDAHTAYAATYRGLFKTIDGVHWRRLPLGGYVGALAIDPRSPSTIYAGGQTDSGEGSVVRSDDRGETWGAPAIVLQDLVVAIAVDEQAPGTVYVSDGYQQIGVSRDGGATWRDGGSIDGQPLEWLVVDPDRAGTVYVTASDRVYRSTDFGGTWTPLGRPDVNGMSGMVLVAGTPPVLVVGSYDGGIRRSADGGTTWTVADSGLTTAMVRTLTAGAKGAVFAGTTRGVFRSEDAGRTWSATELDAHSIDTLAVTGRTLWASIRGTGVTRSTDGGATWQPASAGLGGAAGMVTVGPTGTLYLGANGVFHSSNHGRTWTLSAKGLVDSTIWALVPHPQRAQTIYAATGAGVYVSEDDGESWQPTGLTFEPDAYTVSGAVRALAIDPLRPERMYAATYQALYASTDGGTTWRRDRHRILRGTSVSQIAIDPRHTDTLYIASDRGCTLKSTDAGATWRQLCRRGWQFASLAVDPSRSTTLFAGRVPGPGIAADDLYKSVDGGRSWSKQGLGNAASAIAFDPFDPRHLVSAVWRDVQRSDDSGQSWHPYSAGLGYGIGTLAFAPDRRHVLYAGTQNGMFEIESVEPCHGDCGHDGAVGIDDLLAAVAISLGVADRSTCAAADQDANDSIDVADIIAAVRDAQGVCTGPAAPTYSSPRRTSLAAVPVALFADDGDRDGRVDVLSVDAGGISLLRGDGQGRFAPGPRSTASGRISDARLSDLNRDGAPDLLVESWPTEDSAVPDLHVLLNDGVGSFSDIGSYRLDRASYFRFAAADLDGDGLPDLVMGDGAGTVVVRLGIGDGTFAEPRQMPTGGCSREDDYCPPLAAVIDINGDGPLDIVLDGALFLGHGDGTFASARPGGSWGLFVDADGDGQLDAVWTWRDTFALGFGTGDGGFSGWFSFATGGNCGASAASDLNADGRPDVLCGIAPDFDDGTPRSRNRLALMLNTGDGAFALPQVLFTSAEPTVVAAADVNGDGLVDLLAAGADEPADNSSTVALSVWVATR